MIGGALLLPLFLIWSGVLFYSLFALTQLLASFWPRCVVKESGTASALILIPAMNEATTLGPALTKLLPEIPDSFTVVVLADNCTDETAHIAKSFSRVVVWERHSPRKVGKDYALREAVQRMRREKVAAPVLIVLDVDSFADRKTLLALASLAAHTQRPVQAAQSTPPSGNALSSLGSWWSTAVREQGRSRLRLPHFLHGTGTAFPASKLDIFEKLGGDLVEDKGLTVHFVISQNLPIFLAAHEIIFTNNEAREAWQQRRTRWERAQFAETKKRVPQIINAAIRQRRLSLFFFAVDFSLPPLFPLFGAGFLLSVVGLFSNRLAPLRFIARIWNVAFLLFLAAGFIRVWFSPHRNQIRDYLTSSPRWLFGKTKNYLQMTRRAFF